MKLNVVDELEKVPEGIYDDLKELAGISSRLRPNEKNIQPSAANSNKQSNIVSDIKGGVIQPEKGIINQPKKVVESKPFQKPVPKVGLENGELPVLVKRDLTRTFGHHTDWGGEITLQDDDIKRIQETVESVLKLYLSEGKGREYIQGLGSICLAIVHAIYVGEKTLWYSKDRDNLLAVCPNVFTESNITEIFSSIMHKYGHASAFDNNFEKLNLGCDRMFNDIKVENSNLFEQLFPDGVGSF